MRERIDIVGTGSRVKRALWLGALLALGAFIFLLCLGQALMDAGDVDAAKVTWFGAVPAFLLCLRALYFWGWTVLIGWLVATTRED